MCLSLLRQTTRPAHQILEDRLTGALETISRAGYGMLLAKFLGFYRPMETRLAVLASTPDFPRQFEPQPRTALLVRDLSALGFSENALATMPLCRSLPDLTGAAQALGALYVLEGAALGGQVVAPRLQARLGVTPENGVAFFYGAGPRQVAARWKAFRQVLERWPAQSTDAIAEAALQTFQTFERWLFPDVTASGFEGP